MKKQLACVGLAAALAIGTLAGCGSSSSSSSSTKSSSKNYKPVTIEMNLERSGLGKNYKHTFKKKPTKVVADGDQMADIFFDLGLADDMAGYTEGACVDTVKQYPGEKKVKQLAKPGVNLRSVSKEKVLATGCDFLVGWDDLFSDKNFSLSFCKKNGITPYFPYVCSDSATFDDLYKDYETLGKIFQVEDTAQKRVAKMKKTLDSVHQTLGDEAYQNPVKVFVYDSGEDAPFTACQGMPGDTLKRAGAISIFNDINKGWATPSWEQVAERDPDAILILDYNHDTAKKKKFLKTNKYTKNLRAVKENKIYSANCAIMQGSAGSADLVKSIAKQLYPNKF
jgi:iron complex transport system substrate-binding protein